MLKIKERLKKQTKCNVSQIINAYKQEREKGTGKLCFLMFNCGPGQHQFFFYVYPKVYTTVATILSGIHINTIIKLTGYMHMNDNIHKQSRKGNGTLKREKHKSHERTEVSRHTVIISLIEKKSLQGKKKGI